MITMKNCLGIFITTLMVIASKGNKIIETGIAEITPIFPVIYSELGGTAAVTCRVTARLTTDAYPTWDIPHGYEDNVEHVDNIEEHPTKNSGITVYVSELIIRNIEKRNLGTYICRFETSADTIKIEAPYENKQEGNYTYGDESVTLSCFVPSIANDVTSKEWFKNGTLISELPDKERYTTETTVNNSLTITGITREDAGVYVLRFYRKNNIPPYNCNVAFRAEPLVKKFDKSKNLIEDDTLELQCEVLGYPPATITWLQDNHAFNTTTNKRVMLSPLNGYDNARLVIKNVKFSDAGDYTCKAHSEWFNKSVSQVIIVRVKDKLAALWPFLGIVGEVVILCAIIFIYEKRRNKQAESESNNVQDVDGSASDKKEGLRHRNTQSNNPTA